MATSEISYTASNTDLQAIDTFDLPTILSATYTIHTFGKTDKSITSLNIIHNGSNTAYSQHGTSLSGNTPLPITAEIIDFEGKILVQPTEVPTTFKIFKNELECNLYSENTISGGLIRHAEGFAIDRTGTINSVTVRQANNNFYGNVATFVTGTEITPVSTLDELIGSSWSSYNGSELSSNSSHIIASSSGMSNNCLYQELQVEAGRLYRISGSALHELSDNPIAKQLTYNSRGVPFIKIGDTLGSSEYFNYQTTDSETSFDVAFMPEFDKVFVSFGFGEILSKCIVSDLMVKTSEPWHTYNQDAGTIYLRWNAVGAGNIAFKMNSYSLTNSFRVAVDSSNNIIISSIAESVNCGSQSVSNKIAIAYSNGQITYALNGTTHASSFTMAPNVNNAIVMTQVLQLAYVPTVLSNTELVDLTNV